MGLTFKSIQMKEIILITPEQLEGIINKCLAGITSATNQEKNSEKEDVTYLHSIKDLAEFLNCSIVTAQKLKNSGKIRYKQYGRKVIFNTAEVLEDINKSGRRAR